MSQVISLSPSPKVPSATGSIVEGETPPSSVSLEDSGYYRPDRDVAVVGMACRVAGGNNNPDQLWKYLLEKKDASGEIPPMRWEPYHHRSPKNSKILSQATSKGYFLDRIEDFDCQFFGISPVEAEQMDPQQRLSLEVAYEALENSGIPPKSLSGSDTAVFWGVNSDDYSKLVLEDLSNIQAFMGIGTAYCGVPNRISYHLNLMGPSTAVDAACASSLVAVHHGVQAIILGESKVAIVGGVNALCGPGLTTVLDKAGAVSPEGRCRSFDDSAHGYGRGEGAAAIVLKNVSQAIRDGDHIMAIVKGTAVAQDGKTNGIMAPNDKAQQLVAEKALKVAGVDPRTVEYVECHATSTPLGDPTEITAVSNVYGPGRENNPCYIGSIKPNIGHLEAGAGGMGFIKAVLSLQKGLLAPQANLKKLNTRVNWEKSGLRVVQEATKWASEDGKPRRAAVCSYGYGGTVSHAVIEQFTLLEENENVEIPVELTTQIQGHSLLLLSGPQEKRPRVQAKALKEWMESTQSRQKNLHHIAATLAAHRDHHDYRAALVVDSHEDAIESLNTFSNGSNHPWRSESRVLGSDTNKEVVWVFSGHGAQWTDMGKELLDNPVFYRAIRPLDEIVQQEIGMSPISLLRSGEFDSSDQIQILTYIMQIGISELLHSYGLFPHAVIGHSVGEIAASVVAGALTPEEGAIIISRRSVLYRQVMGTGGMLLVNKSYHELCKELQDRDDLAVAIDSSPSSCVIAGSTEAVAEIKEQFSRQSVKAFTVKTDIAFHSPVLNQLSVPLMEALDGSLAPVKPTRAKLYSTSLQDPRGGDLRDSTYWVNNMVKPVHLTSAVQAAAADSYRVFLEVSSHPLVSHSINETLIDAGLEEYAMIPTLLRNKPSEKNILHAIAQLHCKGAFVDWRSNMRGPWVDSVPTTTWLHRPIWRKTETVPVNTSQTHDVEKHTLLGQRIAVAGTDTTIFTTRLDNDTKPFPGSHPLHGTEIVPAAGLVNTFVKATSGNVLKNVVLRVPVAINAPRSVQIVVHRNETKILSRLIQESPNETDDSSWVTHTTAQWELVEDENNVSQEIIDIEATKARIGNKLADNFSIDYLDKVGVSAMGFPWAVTEHYGNTREMIARVDVAPSVTEDATLPWDASSWAPILDAATSVGSTIFFDEPRLRMPAQIEKINIFTHESPPKIGWLYVQEDKDVPLASHVTVLSNDGNQLAKFTSMRFSEIEGTPGASGSMESLVHQIAWPPAIPAEEPIPLDSIILVSEDKELAESYAQTIPEKTKATLIQDSKDISTAEYLLKESDTAVVYLPSRVSSMEEVQEASENFSWQALELIKFIVNNNLPTKLYILTLCTLEAETPSALAHACLVGLGRVLASEHSDNFGGLFDTEVTSFPLTEMRYIQGADIIRVRDGMARTARLRSLPRYKLLPPATAKENLTPRPEGTYLITGGFGALGLAVAGFLVGQGARRIILNSRRSLPPRKAWNQTSADLASVVAKIQELESQGASVTVLSLDISVPGAAKKLRDALDDLGLPMVRGVVHAAGVLDNELALETTRDAFSRVLSPKITGGLVLNEVFPPRSVDFFVLFSSCGQLVGFTGQSSYGASNAFLDSLATHRRAQGDAAVAFQWTSWRGMGMGASTDFINAELESKGITDITHDEAFAAWLHLAKYDMDHGVVLRSLSFAEGEPLPTPILNDIVVRRMGNNWQVEGSPDSASGGRTDGVLPSSGPELKAYLDQKIKGCVGQVLQMDADEVDSKAALSDLGVDSIMTVSLRRQLQQALKVKVPPTLTWSHPTVNHLVGWFSEKLA